MNPDLAELVPNLLALALLAVAALGALALPWSDRELLASRAAWMQLFAFIVGAEEPLATVSADELLPAPLPRPVRSSSGGLPRRAAASPTPVAAWAARSGFRR